MNIQYIEFASIVAIFFMIDSIARKSVSTFDSRTGFWVMRICGLSGLLLAIVGMRHFSHISIGGAPWYYVLLGALGTVTLFILALSILRSSDTIAGRHVSKVWRP